MMKFRSLLILATVIITATVANRVSLNAESIDFNAVTAKVGKEPVAIFPARNAENPNLPNYDTLNILCIGVDADWDGIYGEGENGDEVPSWWQICGVKNANPNSKNPTELTVRKVMDFLPNSVPFPYRFGFQENTRAGGSEELNGIHKQFLAIRDQDSIRFFNMATHQDAGRAIGNASGAASMAAFNQYVFLSIRESEGFTVKANYVKIFDFHGHNQNNLIDSIPTENYVQRVIPFSFPTNTNTDADECFAVLCEGIFNAESSTVEIYKTTGKFSDKNPIEKLKTVDIGYGGNELVMHQITTTVDESIKVPLFFAVSTNDDKITLLGDDLYSGLPGITKLFLDSNVIQLPEGSKPREISINETVDEETGKAKYSAIIPANSNKVFYLSDLRKTKEIIEIENPQLSESALNINEENIICVYTNPYKDANYAASDEVTILYDKNSGILSNFSYSDKLLIFPNPVSDFVSIIFGESGINEVQNVQILDISGKIVMEIPDFSISGDLLQFKLHSKLNSGKYFVKIESAKKIFIKEIIKQ